MGVPPEGQVSVIQCETPGEALQGTQFKIYLLYTLNRHVRINY
jgi:hypothetical protein